MKSFFVSAFCIIMALCLFGCDKTVPAAQSTDSSSVASDSNSHAGFSSSSQGSDISSASLSSAPTLSTQQFVSIDVSNEDRRALVQFSTPENWIFDNYTGFSVDHTKIAEIAAVWKIENSANPLTDIMQDGFGTTDPMSYPEGFGYLKTMDRKLNGSLTRTYLYHTQPDDAPTPWYPHFTFRVVGDYVVQAHFFSFQETDNDALFDAVLSSMSIHFANETS